ncbi:MAG: DNA-processing protein DprA [Endomicrobiia bacterium]|nr:DNA-processing protein DprA [Endomicrobiia bacterium]
MMNSDKDRIFRLALVLSAGIGRLARARLTKEGALGVSAEELARDFGIASDAASRFASGESLVAAQKEFANAERLGVNIIFPGDEDWPPALKGMSDEPEVLYVKGSFSPSDFFSVAVVGSRRATAYGLAAARKIAFGLGELGVATVSGLARGIDTQAHRASLEAAARTIAVLGNGLSSCYPSENAGLAAEISDGRGVVVSEYPLDRFPDRYTFPRRNRIIAALSLATVVAEADEKSGALITARCAAAEGKDVFAIPGPIFSNTSAGTHALIKSGAKLVHSVSDIVDEISHLADWVAHSPASGRYQAASGKKTLAAPMAASPSPTANLAPPEKKIMEALKPGIAGVSIDFLEHATGIRAGELSGLLVGLEIKGVIRALPGKHYVPVRAV